MQTRSGGASLRAVARSCDVEGFVLTETVYPGDTELPELASDTAGCSSYSELVPRDGGGAGADARR